MPEYIHDQHFTAEEANGLLPRIAPLVMKLQDALALFQSQRAKAVDALKLARGNGKPKPVPEIDGLEIVQDLAGRIEEYGCVLKDFEQGLVDFPSVMDGREVYLCWKLGEPEITAWHELDAGYSARHPL